MISNEIWLPRELLIKITCEYITTYNTMRRCNHYLSNLGAREITDHVSARAKYKPKFVIFKTFFDGKIKIIGGRPSIVRISTDLFDSCVTFHYTSKHICAALIGEKRTRIGGESDVKIGMRDGDSEVLKFERDFVDVNGKKYTYARFCTAFDSHVAWVDGSHTICRPGKPAIITTKPERSDFKTAKMLGVTNVFEHYIEHAEHLMDMVD